MAEKSIKDPTSNDAPSKATGESGKGNTDELEAQDDNKKGNESPAPASKPEDTGEPKDTQLQVDSSSQFSDAFQQSVKEQYDDYRSTARTLMYLIDHRDRVKVSKWLSKLDEMHDDDGQLDRVHYVKYLVASLSGSPGLVEPFAALPPHTVKSLSLVLPGSVFAEILEKDYTELLLSERPSGGKTPAAAERRPPVQHYDHDDRLFFEQQLFPPEGLICYAAAFSALPDRTDDC